MPRHLQARVIGAVGASAWAGIPFGSLAGGLAVSAFGLRPALLAAAAVFGVTTLAPFAFPVWRQMDRRPDSPSSPAPPLRPPPPSLIAPNGRNSVAHIAEDRPVYSARARRAHGWRGHMTA